MAPAAIRWDVMFSGEALKQLLCAALFGPLINTVRTFLLTIVLLTMALLTMALLTMALLTMALLTMAVSVFTRCSTSCCSAR